MPPTTSHSPFPSTTPQYAHLSPRVNHISESRIRKKWKPLPPTSQDRIRQLILTIKAESRATRRGNKKLDLTSHEWDVVVDAMVDRLLSRLPRLPFPPSATTQIDFDYESTLTRSATLSSAITSNHQSCKLLRTQIAKEQRLLARDRRELEGLEENVRNGRLKARREEGRLHGLARGVGTDGNGDLVRQKERGGDGDGDGIEGRKGGGGKVGVVLLAKEVEGDERLAPLVKQLRSHLGSLQGNVGGLGPVRKALEDVEGAVMRFAEMT